MEMRLYPTGKADYRFDSRGRVIVLECRCACGSTVWVDKARFLSGKTRSCGCLIADTAAKVGLSHGMSKTITYRRWIGIRRRCHDSNTEAYRNYGGRGIVVCDRWRYSFQAFLDDMGECPDRHHSIERKDNDGNYEPGNCAWVTSL